MHNDGKEASEILTEDKTENTKGCLDELLESYNRAQLEHKEAINKLANSLRELSGVVFTVNYFGAYFQKEGGILLNKPEGRQYIHTDFDESFQSFDGLIREVIFDEDSWESAAIKGEQMSFAMASVFKTEGLVKQIAKSVVMGKSELIASAIFTGPGGLFTSVVEWTVCPLISTHKDCTNIVTNNFGMLN